MRTAGNMMTFTKSKVDDVEACTIHNYEVGLNVTRHRTLAAVVAKLNGKPKTLEGCIFEKSPSPMLE
jgi:hypothetical protein